jgi:hypothetical protein
MIEIIGDKSSAEYSAAEQLAEVLTDLWPDIRKSPREFDDVRIRVNCHLTGYKIEEIDIVLCARFSRPRSFKPSGLVKVRGGRRVDDGKKILVDNLIAAIEVKDHSGKAIKVQGDTVSVYYGRAGTWSDATDQNRKQVFSLAEYCNDLLGDKPYVHRCLMMRGVPEIKCAGALPAEFDGAQFLTQIAKCSQVLESQGRFFLSSLKRQAEIDRMLSGRLFRQAQASSLDRKRMDRIAGEAAQAISKVAKPGESFIKLRGRGGTGKTMVLLQTAVHRFKEFGHRTLILTYNVALVSDIKRTLYLMGVGSSVEKGGVKVNTVISFLREVFDELGIAGRSNLDFSNHYKSQCEEFDELLASGALSDSDVQSLFSKHPEEFFFDFVAVDEAQDCPGYEVAVINGLFEPEKLIIADGVDQNLRGAQARWLQQTKETQTIPLKKCLRMKRNLAVFANSVARCAGIDWEIEPNSSAPGGRVLILDGPCADRPEILQDLAVEAEREGNKAIDLLYCVPNKQSGSAVGSLTNALEQLNWEVWNGTDSEERRKPPLSVDSHRVVTFQSCRGLEGWAVVLEQLDSYVLGNYYHAKETETSSEPNHGALIDVETYAHQSAWEKTMIALTRPMDTLVISLALPEATAVRAVIKQVSNEHEDFVQWVP